MYKNQELAIKILQLRDLCDMITLAVKFCFPQNLRCEVAYDCILAPDRIKVPKDYPDRKIDAIDTILRNYKGVLTNHGLKVERAIAVSSCIGWMTEDGEEVSVESINNMDESEIAKLQIAFDGRYQIEELLDMLEDVIEDFQAKNGP